VVGATGTASAEEVVALVHERAAMRVELRELTASARASVVLLNRRW
jgi:hypothetical protein